MLRPSAATVAKAITIADGGRVRIVDADDHHVHAVVEGDHGTYHVDRVGRATTCSCPATRPCAHLLATELVVRSGK